MESFFIIDDNVNNLSIFEVSFIMSNFKTNVCVANNDKEIILRDIEKIKPDYLLLSLKLKTKNAFSLLEYFIENSIHFKEIFVYADVINRELIDQCEKYNVMNFFDQSNGLNSISKKVIKIIKNKNRLLAK